MADTTFTIEQPKEQVRTTALYPGVFNDDLKFTFEVKDFHTTDRNEVEQVFADLDLAVLEVKKSWSGR